jgi:cysteine desulfurase
MKEIVGKGFLTPTRGGSEANFLLYLSFYLSEVKRAGKNLLLIPAHEEYAMRKPLGKMEEFGCVVKEVDKTWCLEAKPKTALLSFSWANRLTGEIYPVEEIVSECKKQGIKVHLNATAVMGLIPISFDELGVDYLTLDGPVGSGLLVQKEAPQESFTGYVDLKELQESLQKKEKSVLEMTRLRDAFENELCYTLPDTEVLLKESARLPNVSLLAFPAVMNETLLFMLERKGVLASIGGQTEPLLSSQLKHPLRFSAISFTFAPTNTEDDLAKAAHAVVSSVRSLSTLSHAL